VRRALQRQDAALGRLVAGLDARDAFGSTTLLVVSDHGMARVERSVDLDAALQAAGLTARVWGAGGFATVTVTGDEGVVERVLTRARALGLEAHRRADAPKGLRSGHPRFGDVLVLAPPGVALVTSRSRRAPLRGAHGYPPDDSSMDALFVAAGRGVRPGTRLGGLRAVDVAPTVLALLGAPVPESMEGRPIAALLGESGGPPARTGER
jgi:arylsulfatase A-like enzyme